jgi:hypothetical protein
MYLLFQPRLGLAYALTPKTALRAGVGMFANRTAINRDTALGGNAPFQPQQTVINGSADAPNGATPRLFPFTLTSQDPVFKIPVAWNWNATFQREIGWGTTVEVGYVGRRGIHNQRKRNINQLLPGTIQANPGVNANALRPYVGLGILGLAENFGSSLYNGLQVSLERRFATGLQFGLAYTFSRSTDNTSSLTDVLPNSYDDRGYQGLSDFDRTHVLILNTIYEFGNFSSTVGNTFFGSKQCGLCGSRRGQRKPVLESGGRSSSRAHQLYRFSSVVQQKRIRAARGWNFRRPAPKPSPQPRFVGSGYQRPEKLPHI